MTDASGSSDAPLVALAVWSTVCDPCSCMNISCRVLSLSAFSRGTLEGNTFTMIGAGPTWSDRDRARWQLVEDPGLVELSRTGVQQAASPDEPSRLPEGVAQPASSLRVQNVSAPRVCQRGTRCAERDFVSVEICQQVAGDTRCCAPPCMRMAPTGPQECRTSVAIMPKQLFWYADRYPIRSWLSATPSLDTPAARPRPVQSNPSRAWTTSAVSDLRARIFVGRPNSL